MSVDPLVLSGIRSLVENDPANLPMKRHLAQLLLAAGDAHEAQRHISEVLAEEPDDLAALAVAARVADALGLTVRADGYRRLQSSLERQVDSSSASPESSSSELDETPADGEPALFPPLQLESPLEKPERLGLRLVEGNRPADVVPDPEPPAPVVTLNDVAGMESVKRRLNLAFLAPLRNPELRRSFGKSLRGGLLLYGPPGCGKTFIARATAGELGAKFMPVGIADVLSMWLGQSEQQLKGYFEAARRQAPSVLFFDEVDALGRKRSLMRHTAGSSVVSQFLAELDGLQGDNQGVFVLAATNHPWDVDSALRRPGRFDRMLLVLPPDRAAREVILRSHCHGRPIGDDVDFGWLALKDVRPSIRSWLETAKNHALFANDGGVYDDLLEYLKARRIV